MIRSMRKCGGSSDLEQQVYKQSGPSQANLKGNQANQPRLQTEQYFGGWASNFHCTSKSVAIWGTSSWFSSGTTWVLTLALNRNICKILQFYLFQALESLPFQAIVWKWNISLAILRWYMFPNAPLPLYAHIYVHQCEYKKRWIKVIYHHSNNVTHMCSCKHT